MHQRWHLWRRKYDLYMGGWPRGFVWESDWKVGVVLVVLCGGAWWWGVWLGGWDGWLGAGRVRWPASGWVVGRACSPASCSCRAFHWLTAFVRGNTSPCMELQTTRPDHHVPLCTLAQTSGSLRRSVEACWPGTRQAPGVMPCSAARWRARRATFTIRCAPGWLALRCALVAQVTRSHSTPI